MNYYWLLTFYSKLIQNKKRRYAYVKCARSCTEPSLPPCAKLYAWNSILPPSGPYLQIQFSNAYFSLLIKKDFSLKIFVFFVTNRLRHN